jgi:alpha-tubulin suppressor-like RCC1 family protein
VQCWGDNAFGQLGAEGQHWTPVSVTGLASAVAAIAAGRDHTCALSTDGYVDCWGHNGNGQLNGYFAGSDSSVPVRVGLTNLVSAIAAGGDHSCALASNGVWCWGSNNNGQLGNGTPGAAASPPVRVTGTNLNNVGAIEAGLYHTCAIYTGGDVSCWGSNEFGQLGDRSTTDRSAPVSVTGLAIQASSIALGDYYTCALALGGGMQCWGENFYSQLGTGTNPWSLEPVSVRSLPSAVSAIAAGDDHTCALTTEGAVDCWGWNTYGELGDGGAAQPGSGLPVAVAGLGSGVRAVAAGRYHACALTTGGGVKCWGRNQSGQLGDGTTTDRKTPVAVTGLASGVAAIAAGTEHTCALMASGGVQCWGLNHAGQLGDGTISDYRSTPAPVAGLPSAAAAIRPGGSHTCALVANGVWCWGSNYYGQLGIGETPGGYRTTPISVSGLASGIVAIAAGWDHSCAVTSDGGARCWGRNSYRKLGDGSAVQESNVPVAVSGLNDAVAIEAGWRHTCALTADGEVACWGANDAGQLGDGTGATSYVPVTVEGLDGVSEISLRMSHTCARTANGAISCWGIDNYGQLGDGHQERTSQPVYVVPEPSFLGGLLAALASLAVLGRTRSR